MVLRDRIGRSRRRGGWCRSSGNGWLRGREGADVLAEVGRREEMACERPPLVPERPAVASALDADIGIAGGRSPALRMGLPRSPGSGGPSCERSSGSSP